MGVDEHKALFKPAIVVASLHLTGDVDEFAAGGDFEPEFFAVAFHGRLLIRDSDDDWENFLIPMC